MSIESDRLRNEAKRCRDLAVHMHTQSTREMLERMAQEFDDEANKIEADIPQQMPRAE
jgi:hypothetical protein